jgi:hypothetical protein
MVPNSYYGHPNPARGQYEWKADLADGTPHVPPMTEFPLPAVVTDLGEYTSAANGGLLQGHLLLPGFLDDNIYWVALSANGQSVTGQGVLAGGFQNPLALTVGPDGTIYVLEAGASLEFSGFGPAKLTALIPETPSAS